MFQFTICASFPSYVLSWSYSFAGETDWKILVIDVQDPLAEKLNGKYSSQETLIQPTSICLLEDSFQAVEAFKL